VVSAGVLAWRRRPGLAEPEFLLVHPGGPFWAKKDLGVWSVPKGEHDAAEEALAAAHVMSAVRREQFGLAQLDHAGEPLDGVEGAEQLLERGRIEAGAGVGLSEDLPHQRQVLVALGVVVVYESGEEVSAAV